MIGSDIQEVRTISSARGGSIGLRWEMGVVEATCGSMEWGRKGEGREEGRGSGTG